MDLFKLVGKIVVDNKEAISNLKETSEQAKETGDAIGDANKKTDSSNKNTSGTFSALKSKVDEYKSKGMSTSQAWRAANADMKKSAEDNESGTVSAFKKIGIAVGTYLSVSAIKNFGEACIQAAADANATNSQFSQVFGDLEGQASKSLSGIADSAGISENRMKGSYTKIAAFAKTTGMETEDALDLSNRAMLAVADSAAFYDRSLEETTESLQSFLKGNFENDAALGLSCTETTRNAAANELYGKSFKDLSEQQKQLTLLKMVEDANKTSGALGQAARESDTWTNVTGNLKQSWTDFQAVIGSAVLPGAVKVVKTMVGWVESWTAGMPALVNWCKEHKTTLTYIGIALGTVAAAIGAYNIALNAAKIATALHTAVTTVATTATAAFGSVMAFLTSPVTLVVLAIGALIAAGVALYKNWDVVKAKCLEIFGVVKDFLSGVWDSVKEKITSVWNSVTSFLSSVWDTIKNVVTVGVMLVGEILQTAFDIITLPFRFIWENCKEYVFAAWEWIKEKVSTAINAVSTTISKVWNSIKQTTSKVWDAIKSAISKVWEPIKKAVTSAVEAVKSKISSAFNAVKSTVSSIMNSVKSAISTAWNTVKNTVSNAVSGVKSTISNGFTAAKNTVSNILGGIKSKFTSIFDSVKKTVSGAIEKIKGYFNFSWSLPKLKMPHFSISGKFSLDPPSIPKISVDWYAKAMNNAMMLKQPTIFGYSAESGKFLGGGEAGNEVVAGADTLMNMISAAVAAQNDGVVYYLQKLIEILATYFPQVLEMMKQPIPAVVEPNGAAAALAVPMNRELGKLSGRKERGR